MQKFTLSAALPLILLACSSGGPARGQNQGQGANDPGASVQSETRPFKVADIATFDAPWAMTFLPDGRLLVTEKAGRMKLFSPATGSQVAVGGIPPVDSKGQGALMDVVLHPQFASNHIVYFSFSEAGADGKKGVVLATGKLTEDREGARLDDMHAIFRGDPWVTGDAQYSGRIAFSPDGRYLFFTNGERMKFTPAQDPGSTLGKVLRLNLDGSPAAGNPLAARGFNPAIWSYGHRNMLGIAFDKDGRLWEDEMGPMGGDEVNLIGPGLNYGWPVVSNGDNYDGTPIPRHATRPDLEAPKLWWNPSISPAGLIYYTGAMFPAWRGSLFLGGLSGSCLIRVELNGGNARKADQWDMETRIREVEQGPDGALWLLEDGSPGRLMKLTPA